MIVNLQKVYKSAYIFCLYLLIVASVGAQVPAGLEPYSVRPDILTLKPQAHASLPKDWNALKRGHLEAVAMLLELYPTHELYFLARDGELLYDFARVATRDDPAQAQRLKLLNVSRANMRDPNIREYLSQEGINNKALEDGKKVLFVDTGFSGTIPKVLQEYFPAPLHGQLKTHLMASANPEHPSSRVFLTAINPAAPSMPPGSLHGSVVAYEHIPRFTDRSTKFARVPGAGGVRWDAVSRESASTAGADGSVSKKIATQYMEDLLAYAQSDEAQKLIQQRRTQWRRFRDLAFAGDRQVLVDELKNFVSQDPNDVYRQAMARDFVETLSIHGLESKLSQIKVSIDPTEIGLQAIATGGATSNKMELMKKHPEWKAVLENPETGIKQLIDQGEWGKLGAISDVINDDEFWQLLAQSLGEMKPTKESRAFIRMLIEKGDQEVLNTLAIRTFSLPHTKDMQDLLRLLIEKGDQEVLRLLAIYTFSQPHTKDMQDLLRLLIEKGDQSVLVQLAAYTFSRPHTKDMQDILRLLIEKGDQTVLVSLARHPFSLPHTKDMQDLLRLLIEKGDQEVLRLLAISTFSQPHTKDMQDLLRLVIEKGDQKVLEQLAFTTFSKAHFASPKYDIFREAIKIEDPIKRKAFLHDRLGALVPTQAPKNCEKFFLNQLKPGS